MPIKTKEVLYAPRMLVFNKKGGLVVTQRHAIHGGPFPEEINPEEIGFIYVDDETTPAVRVNPDTLEVEWEPVDTPTIEDVAASLIQQGITPDMLSQIQETMTQQAAPIRQQAKLTE